MKHQQEKPAIKLLLLAAWCCSALAIAQDPASGNTSSSDTKPTASAAKKPSPDRSGDPRTGKASFYGKEFYGKKMADGTPMNPDSNVAASRTLPLGTKAEVKNLENGKSEVVEIRDRGPYVSGRIVDVSPKIADKLDMTDQGVAPVLVTPLEVPLPDGSVKPGKAGATSSGR